MIKAPVVQANRPRADYTLTQCLTNPPLHQSNSPGVVRCKRPRWGGPRWRRVRCQFGYCLEVGSLGVLGGASLALVHARLRPPDRTNTSISITTSISNNMSTSTNTNTTANSKINTMLPPPTLASNKMFADFHNEKIILARAH